MKSITIDILNDKAINLLRELEVLNLIRLRKEPNNKKTHSKWLDFKGSMTRQAPESIDIQLKELRDEWE